MKYLVEINGRHVEVNPAGGDTIVTGWGTTDIPIVLGGADFKIICEQHGVISLAEARVRARDEANPWRRHFMLLREQSEKLVAALDKREGAVRGAAWNIIHIRHTTTAQYAAKMQTLAEDDGKNSLIAAIDAGRIKVFAASGHQAPLHRLHFDGIPGTVDAVIFLNDEPRELFVDAIEFNEWLHELKEKAAKSEEDNENPQGTAHAVAWLQSGTLLDGSAPLPSDPQELVVIARLKDAYRAHLKRGGDAVPSNAALGQRIRRALARLDRGWRLNKEGAGRPPRERRAKTQ